MTARKISWGLALYVAGALAVLVPQAALADSDSINPPNTAFTGSLKMGTDAVFTASVGGLTVQVTCTSSTISGTTPASGINPFTLSGPPTFSGCNDNFGGTDTVDTTGNWTLNFVDNDGTNATDQLLLGIPPSGATVTTSGGTGSGCVTTVNSGTSTVQLPMSYDDKGTAIVDDTATVPISISGDTCPLAGDSGTQTEDATYVMSPAFSDTGDGGSSGSGLVVTTAAPSGPGSLLAAIQTVDSSKATKPQTITFDIPGSGTQTISPTTALPTITKPVIIDATTQPGYSGTPLIDLDGSAATTGDGLDITAGASTVKGLEITDWSRNGIELSKGTKNTVEGNYIGTDGSNAKGNGLEGVLIDNASSANIIGGAATGDENVISGNDLDGVDLEDASKNFVQGNLIGTDSSDSKAIANLNNGIEIWNGGSANTIGGTATGDGNVISGNGYAGIIIWGSKTTKNVIEGNDIGTDAGASTVLANPNGVSLYDGTNANTIGAATAGAGNVISGNTSAGVDIYGMGTTKNVVAGDYIGTNSSGAAKLGNSQGGVEVYSYASGNTIGGTVAGARDVISGNGGPGIQLFSSADGNVVEGDYIGITPDGTTALANDGDGVQIYADTSKSTIGGTEATHRDVISGNDGNGVSIFDSSAGTTKNVVEGDYIGTDSTGQNPVPNTGDGVDIYSTASGNTVGGTASGAGNVIDDNGSNGVEVDGSNATGNPIETNSIFDNTASGIALTSGGDGNEQPPTISTVTPGTKSTVITGTLPSSDTSGSFRIEVFANPSCSSDQGQTYLGETSASGSATASKRTWKLTVALSKIGSDTGFTATATDTKALDTSPFSTCVSS